MSDTSGPPWLAERATHFPVPSQNEDFTGGPRVDLHSLLDRVGRLERSLGEVERLVASQLREPAIPPPLKRSEPRPLTPPNGGVESPCCGKKRKALDAVKAAWEAEPYELMFEALAQDMILRTPNELKGAFSAELEQTFRRLASRLQQVRERNT